MTEIISVDDKPVDFRTVQAIYNDLTGKTETQSVNLDYAFTIRIEDLQTLNHTVQQCADSSGARLKSCSVTVYHSNKSKDQFSSFERFNIYNFGNTSPIENILVEYDFLIQNPTSGNAAIYKVSIHTTSTFALSAQDSSLGLPPPALRKLLAISPLRFKVTFVDYVVGRSFLQALKEWADGLDKKEPNKLIEKAQSFSHWSRPTFATVSSLVFMYFVFNNLTSFPTTNLNSLFRSLVGVAGATILLWQIGTIIGSIFERNVDRINHQSVLLLNKGDERCFKKRETNNKNASLNATFSIVLAVGINIASNYISSFILGI
ncbi:hypothetical protein [Celeribacter halophilus]|uniref:hypothetical protein n=1 Tax=Celeribacter halophilus TaxID=576117 RepID=UPI003A8FBEA9